MLDPVKAPRKNDGNGTNQWLKKAVLLSFRLKDMALTGGGPGKSKWWDKVPSKFEGWTAKDFRAGGFRAVPNCVVRHSLYRTGCHPHAVLCQSRLCEQGHHG
jgi:2,3,4,5-tetrahydropyridine-2-carboxylate N-succinyltransferase